MQNYHKITIGLKIIKLIIIGLIALYCVSLSTNSILHLSTYDNIFIDCGKMIYDTYIITFIMSLFVVLLIGIKYKFSLLKVYTLIIMVLLFLPISALLIYNFKMFDNLMCSFYIMIICAVIVVTVDSIIKRINKLYNLAVGSTNFNNRKGETKVCKKK